MVTSAKLVYKRSFYRDFLFVSFSFWILNISAQISFIFDCLHSFWNLFQILNLTNSSNLCDAEYQGF